MVEGRHGPAERWPQGAVGRGGEEVLSRQGLVHPEHQIDVLSNQNCRVRYLSGGQIASLLEATWGRSSGPLCQARGRTAATRQSPLSSRNPQSRR